MNRRSSRGVFLKYATVGAVAFAPLAAGAQSPTSPPVNFTNDKNTGSTLVNLVDSYAWLMVNNPAVMTQNIQTVIDMTKARTAAQTLAAVHDDRTDQQYSVFNGLGALTSYFMSGSGASTTYTVDSKGQITKTAPTSLTPTSYVTTTLQDYAFRPEGINYLNSNYAQWGWTKFGDGTATPLAAAVNFVDNVVRANSSTEATKRTFERFMGSTSPVTTGSLAGSAISPLDPRYANYKAPANPTGLTPADTANFVIPSYFSNFTVPAVYGNVTNWVQGFTVTQAMVDANGGKPLTAPNLGTYDAGGNFTPFTFGVGAYVPGIGTAPRPYRLSADVNVPTQLYQIINNTNPYGDGAFISGHTNSAYTQALGLAFLAPQQYQQLLFRASDLGNNRILAGQHSPLDVMGGRMFATALAATNIYNALYDANGNRVDWTNPSNSAAYAVYQAYTQTQGYLAQACGAVSVQACILQAQQSAATSDPYAPSAQNQALYTARLTYGFSRIGPTNLPEVVPVQAQVLLLTRFPYLTDQQRTDVLRTTALPSGYPLLDGNTWDGWGRLNLYAAANGYGAFDGAVSVTMDAAQGGYNAFDIWSNNIGGAGSLTKDGSGALVLAGNNTYSGGTMVAGGSLIVAGSIAGPVNVAAGGTLSGVGTVGSLTVSGALAPGLPSIAGLTGQIGALTIAGNLQLNAGSNYLIQVTPTNASSAVVNGAATIAGAMTASFAPGLYTVGSRLPVLTTANGLTGAFSSLSYNCAGPINVRPSLAYDGQSAFLILNQAMLPALSAGATGNATRVWGALNGLIATGGVLPASFQSLYFETPSAIASTMSQMASQTGPAATQSVSRTMNGFLTTVLDFGGPGRLASIANGAGGMNEPAPYAQGSAPLAYAKTAPKGAIAKKASGAFNSIKPSPVFVPSWSVWASAFGGGSRISGDVNTGSQNVNSNVYGLAVGADYRLTPDTTLGFALSGGETNFSLAGSAGSGNADFFQGAAYARHWSGDAYVSATLAAGAHWVTATRSVAVGLAPDTLTASYTAPTIAGRIETGYRFAFGQFGLTPYGAAQAQQIWTPAHAETATSGTGATALTFGAHDVALPRTELGAWADHRFFGDIVLRGRLAWVHDYNRDASTIATFQALPGASFLATGAQRPANAALFSAIAEVRIAPNVTFSTQFDGEFSRGAGSWAGSGRLRYVW